MKVQVTIEIEVDDKDNEGNLLDGAKIVLRAEERMYNLLTDAGINVTLCVADWPSD